MAPIYAAAVGVNPQSIDVERLRRLRDALMSIELQQSLDRTFDSPQEVTAPLDIDRLIMELEPSQTWVYEEQVSLF